MQSWISRQGPLKRITLVLTALYLLLSLLERDDRPVGQKQSQEEVHKKSADKRKLLRGSRELDWYKNSSLRKNNRWIGM